MTKDQTSTLLKAAQSAMEKAYCPYSSFPVGAAIADDAGAVHVGCNIENAAFGTTQCAEAGALAAAVAGGTGMFTHVAVVTSDGSTPCGNCRQMLMELAPDADVLIASANDLDHPRKVKVRDLLPDPFLGDSLT
jgi:cytidine deaminase